MNPIVIDKENALISVQKIIKLVSSWRRLKVEEINEWDYNPKIQKSLDKALKEYESWDYSVRFIKEVN